MQGSYLSAKRRFQLRVGRGPHPGRTKSLLPCQYLAGFFLHLSAKEKFLYSWACPCVLGRDVWVLPTLTGKHTSPLCPEWEQSLTLS